MSANGFNEPCFPLASYAIWNSVSGWSVPKVVEVENLPTLPPIIHGLHYGTSVFEGMQARINQEGKLIIFRLLDHGSRLNLSISKIKGPQLPRELFENAILGLLRTEGAFKIDPKKEFLYIRPIVFNCSNMLGPYARREFRLYVFTAPHPINDFVPVSCQIETNRERAGIPTAKIAGNYAGTVESVDEANDQGLEQVLWTSWARDRSSSLVTEFSYMNCFMVKNQNLITPSLRRGTILHGITRNTVLQVAQRQFGIEVSEEDIGTEEMAGWIKNRSVTEFFGTGTAATLMPIQRLMYEGRELMLPEYRPTGISHKIWSLLSRIHMGELYSEFTTVV